MDKPAPYTIDASKVIITDDAGNKATLQRVIQHIIMNLCDLNEAVFDDEEHTTTH